MYDSYGRFLDNDPDEDRLVARAPEDCPNGFPGLIFDVDPGRTQQPFMLIKRETRPMPLPMIEPVIQQGVALSLRITDSDGPFVEARGGFIASHEDGSVTLGEREEGESILLTPIPMRTAKNIFPDSGLVLKDQDGHPMEAPRPTSGLRVLIGERAYSLEVIGSILTRMGTIPPGESTTLVLPATASEPEETITAARYMPPRS
nr:hypothetical protein [Acetobacter conturbans]